MCDKGKEKELAEKLLGEAWGNLCRAARLLKDAGIEHNLQIHSDDLFRECTRLRGDLRKAA